MTSEVRGWKGLHPDGELMLLVFLGAGQEVGVVLLGGVGAEFTRQTEIKIL